MILSDETIRNTLKKRSRKASQIIRSAGKSQNLWKDVERKIANNNTNRRVRAVIDYVELFASMIVSYAKKEYTDVPTGTLIAMTACLLYFCSPLDIIPDFLPLIGFLDDAAVIGYSVQFVKADLDKYKAWKAKEDNIIDVQITEHSSAE